MKLSNPSQTTILLKKKRRILLTFMTGPYTIKHQILLPSMIAIADGAEPDGKRKAEENIIRRGKERI